MKFFGMLALMAAAVVLSKWLGVVIAWGVYLLMLVPFSFMIYAVAVFWWGHSIGVRFIVRRRRRTFVYAGNIAFALGLAYLASWLDRLAGALSRLLWYSVQPPGIVG